VHSPEIESNKDLEKLFKDQMSSAQEDFSSAASLLLKEEEEAAARHKKKHGRDLLTTPAPTTTPAEYSPNDEYTSYMISSTDYTKKYVLMLPFLFLLLPGHDISLNIISLPFIIVTHYLLSTSH
jgi:hypothetical protein